MRFRVPAKIELEKRLNETSLGPYVLSHKEIAIDTSQLIGDGAP